MSDPAVEATNGFIFPIPDAKIGMKEVIIAPIKAMLPTPTLVMISFSCSKLTEREGNLSSVEKRSLTYWCKHTKKACIKNE